MIIHNKISPCETSIYIELIFHLSGNSRCSNIGEGYFKHFYNVLRLYMEHLTIFAGSQDKDNLMKCQSIWTFLATFLLKKIGWKTNLHKHIYVWRRPMSNDLLSPSIEFLKLRLPVPSLTSYLLVLMTFGK